MSTRPRCSGLDTFGLIRILMSRDSAAEFKKALAKTFAQMESLTAAMEGPDGSAILSGRNDVVGRKIKEVLANKKQRRIAVFYGAAHMPGIETSLVTEHEGEGFGRRMARGVDDAEVKNGDTPHFLAKGAGPQEGPAPFAPKGEMGNVPILHETARGYEPSTRNSDARFLSAASAFATCGSSAWPSMSRKNT